VQTTQSPTQSPDSRAKRTIPPTAVPRRPQTKQKTQMRPRHSRRDAGLSLEETRAKATLKGNAYRQTRKKRYDTTLALRLRFNPLRRLQHGSPSLGPCGAKASPAVTPDNRLENKEMHPGCNPAQPMRAWILGITSRGLRNATRCCSFATHEGSFQACPHQPSALTR
jgi:hypothetical protein